ncbi:MAG: DUF6525 family protein [Mangrovicoccus sp.]
MRKANLGTHRQKMRRRGENPMRAYDALPQPLRQWMAQAALPWSPASCRKIWQRARASGEPVEAILARLDRAEAACLARDHG